MHPVTSLRTDLPLRAGLVSIVGLLVFSCSSAVVPAPGMIQFARPAQGGPGVVHEMADVQHAMSEDGRCIAYWQYELGSPVSFHALDLVRERSFDLAVEQPTPRAGTTLFARAVWMP
jgi:hypothetical protein